MSHSIELPEESVKTPWLNDVWYDRLKYIALVLLPALATMYFALANIWGLPYAEQVVGTIVVIDTFLGVIVKYAADQYDKSDAKYDGDMIVLTDQEGNKTFTLDLANNPEALESQNQIVFRVNRNE